MRYVFGYVLALIILGWLPPLLGFAFFCLLPPPFRPKALAVASVLLQTFTSMVLAVLAFGWTSSRLGSQPVLAMFALPYVYLVQNGVQRIRQADVGRPAVRRFAGDQYDPAFQRWLERSCLAGDLIGLTVGLLWLGKMPVW